jgi:hypothetical protein
VFNPLQLFANGEAGAWYDPGDLTAEKVAWRRNLLTWSEQFDNAAWVKADATVTANAGVAPDGTTTADKLVENTAANVIHRLQATVSLGGSVDAAPYVFSIYAKADGRSIIRIYDNNQNTSGVSFFDLSAGTVASGTGSIVSFGNGWYRCSVFPLRNFSTSAVPRVELVQSGTTVQYTGDGTSGVLLWGAQLELGTTASAYQRITDFTSDFLAAFPTHALYQDAAGTTPVTALGQPVGLALDKSRGALANLGPELAATLPTPTIIDFGGSVGAWNGTTREMSNTVTGTDNAYPRFQFALGMTVGARYMVRGRLSGNLAAVASGSNPSIRLATGGTANNISFNATTGTFWGVQVAGATSLQVLLNGTIAAPVAVVIDEISVREVPGVHAIQATSASRPALDARVNLLTRTEEFDNAAWTKAGASVTANSVVAPDGTTTADTLIESATTGGHRVEQTFAAGIASYRWSVYARANQRSVLQLFFDSTLFGVNAFANFDLSSGTLGTVGSAAVASIETVGSSFYRLTLVAAATTAGTGTAFAAMATSTTTGRNPSYTGDGTSGLYLWGADLRLATDAAYPYQRVVTATDYADVGVPRSFLHDGFDDSSYTASSLDLSGTDKVTVWAGVYKNSDAAAAALIELTATPNTSNGAFTMLAPGAASPIFDFFSKGDGTQRGATATPFPAPISRAVTGIADIAAPVVSIRINGVQSATNTSSQGTGNYSNAVLYMGRRNNASFPFNGKIYTIIIRGGVTDAATLALTERYVGSRMGIVL